MMNREELWRLLAGYGFKELRLLRDGSSSLVFVSKYTFPSHHRSTTVAIKCNLIDSPSYWAERTALSMLSHDGIIKLYQILELGKYGILVLERLDQDLLDTIEARKLTINEVKMIFYKVCLAIQECHRHHIAHADIKPENVLVSLDLSTVKIIDFGCSMGFQPGVQVQRTPAGTFFYSPPEVGKNQFFPAQVDIWSLGILLHVLLTSTWPFAGHTYEMACAQASAGVIQLAQEFPSDAVEFIHGMLHLNPLKRMSIEQILSHPWLNGHKELSKETIILSHEEEKDRESQKRRSNSPEKRLGSNTPSPTASCRLRRTIFAPIRKILTR